MGANEKGQFFERLQLATEAGDSKEAARLVASDWAAASTAQQARELLADITQGKALTAAQSLHHALLVALSIGNELAVARAECSALRKRVEELEARPTLGYRGIWDQG